MVSCSLIHAPTSPLPETTLSTPGGNTSPMTFPIFSAVNGVNSDGFQTTEFPARRAGAIFEIGVSTKERGWGVGLSLTRRIVEEMHDGSIQLEHSESGAHFRLELPMAHPQAEASAV